MNLDEIFMIHDVAMTHHQLKFAPSPLVMGKSRIFAVASSSPVTQVIWRPVNMMRETRDRLQKVTLKRKGQHAAKTNQTRTPHASWTMWEDHQFPDDQEDSYLAMNDPPPLDRCKTSRNQVHHVMMICFLCISRKMPIRTVISGNGFHTSRHISLWCSIWRPPTHQESVYHVEEMEFIDPQTMHIDQCATWPIVGTSIHSGPSIKCNNGMWPSLKTPLSD